MAGLTFSNLDPSSLGCSTLVPSSLRKISNTFSPLDLNRVQVEIRRKRRVNNTSEMGKEGIPTMHRKDVGQWDGGLVF